MSLVDIFFSIAKKELGVKEGPPGQSNPRIIEYHATTSLRALSDQTPWCSSFVNWTVRKAGLNGTNSAAADSWLTWGKAIAHPIQGCIVILKRQENPIRFHVTFYNLGINKLISCLGGNQHDCVCFANYLESNVVDYRIPAGQN